MQFKIFFLLTLFEQCREFRNIDKPVPCLAFRHLGDNPHGIVVVFFPLDGEIERRIQNSPVMIDRRRRKSFRQFFQKVVNYLRRKFPRFYLFELLKPFHLVMKAALELPVPFPPEIQYFADCNGFISSGRNQFIFGDCRKPFVSESFCDIRIGRMCRFFYLFAVLIVVSNP
ncbi:MAG: hypothetical protein LUM44_11370 [Pyrinomonadaceae bacterium]|nr:hypothetical protein [Pyrinomonadaceae bacterium]